MTLTALPYTAECLVSSVKFPFIRIRFRNRFRKTVSVLPFRDAVP